MATVVMFHHALGLTAALRDYADVLRSFGHDVHTPDMFDGHTFADVHLGVSFAESMGFDTMVYKAEAAVSVLPPDVVYIGFSLGVLPAQHLAHVRAGALGAVFLYACAPETMFGQPLPSSLPLQIHGNEYDPYFVHDGDLDNARAIVDSHPEAELYLYPGKGHLFAETDHPDFEADSAMQARGRIASFLASVS